MNYIKLLRIQGKGNGYLKEASHNMIERRNVDVIYITVTVKAHTECVCRVLLCTITYM